MKCYKFVYGDVSGWVWHSTASKARYIVYKAALEALGDARFQGISLYRRPAFDKIYRAPALDFREPRV